MLILSPCAPGAVALLEYLNSRTTMHQPGGMEIFSFGSWDLEE